MIAGAVYKALIAAGVPVGEGGVRVGKVDDKKTWSIDFAPDASDRQKADAKAVIESFDVAAERAKPEPQSLEQRVAALESKSAGIEAKLAASEAAQAKK